MLTPRITLLAIAASLIGLAHRAEAQTVFAWDGAGAVGEFEGGAGGACPPPAGPLIQGYPILGPAPCPLPAGGAGPIPGGPGGIAYDATTDQLFVSDGVLVGVYTASGGAFVDSFALALPFLGFGLGVDARAGVLWTTDGFGAAAGVAIPPAPLCGGPTALAVPIFPLPPAPAPITAIDWDPLGGFLWLGDLAGNVQSVFPGGAPGPFGIFPAAASGCFAPGAPVFDLTVDTTSGLVGTLFVSDGGTLTHMLPGGGPPPPTFAFPAACTPAPFPPIRLAGAARSTPFGAGGDATGLPAPTASTTGAIAALGAPLVHNLAGAFPGGIAALYLSGANLCPALPLLGVPAYLPLAPPPVSLGAAPVGFAGAASLPTPIPPAAPLGAQLFTQWFVLTPLFTAQSSNPLGLRVGTY